MTLTQRSHQWRIKRAGMVTASRFADVMTQPREKYKKEQGLLSKTAETYLHELLAEMITGVPLDRFTSPATDWGIEHERMAFDQAVHKIEQLSGKQPELPVGENAFFEHPEEPGIGCSPDGILGDDGLLEIKCGYNPRTHLENVLGGWVPEKYKAQVQGSLWITGRTHYIFVSFDPRYEGTAIDPLLVVQVRRDDQYLENELAPAIIKFRNTVLDRYKEILADHRQRFSVPF